MQGISVCWFYISGSILNRFPIEAVSYDICPPLSDLLDSVWWSLGPSMLLQMALFHSFLWLTNIPSCIHTASSLFLHIPSMKITWKKSDLMYTHRCVTFLYTWNTKLQINFNKVLEWNYKKIIKLTPIKKKYKTVSSLWEWLKVFF